jgi:glycosyltransferase involved in cell wall biosynthesis
VEQELPLVSIVTPSLNQEQFLPAAIESVLRQDYPRIEYLVVDGGSTDGTLDILRSYGDRLRWISEPDTGQANAINKGFRMARGDIVAWINADDVLLKGAVGKAAAALAADPELGMVYGEGYLIDEQGAIQGRFPYTEPFNLWRLVYYGDTILQQTAFLRRAALEEIGYVNETLNWGLDWDLFIRLGKRYRVQYLAEDLGCLRVYSATKTSTGGYRRVQELGRVIELHAGRKLTPSYLAYAGDYSASQLPEVVRGKLPGRLGNWAARAVQTAARLCHRRVWRYMEQGQGWYRDAGAGPQAHFLLPNLRRPARLVIEGRLPQLTPQQPRQTLAVAVNGRELCRVPLEPGSFRVAPRLPDWTGEAEVLRVDLLGSICIANSFYPPLGRNRRISYYLDRVEVEPVREAEADEPAGHAAGGAAAD